MYPIGYETRPSIIFDNVQARWSSGKPIQTRAMVWTAGTNSEYADNVAAAVLLNENVSATTSLQQDAIHITYRVFATIDEVALGTEKHATEAVCNGPSSEQCGHGQPARRSSSVEMSFFDKLVADLTPSKQSTSMIRLPVPVALISIPVAVLLVLAAVVYIVNLSRRCCTGTVRSDKSLEKGAPEVGPQAV